jgi:hypothetical protein
MLTRFVRHVRHGRPRARPDPQSKSPAHHHHQGWHCITAPASMLTLTLQSPQQSYDQEFTNHPPSRPLGTG